VVRRGNRGEDRKGVKRGVKRTNTFAERVLFHQIRRDIKRLFYCLLRRCNDQNKRRGLKIGQFLTWTTRGGKQDEKVKYLF